MNVHDQYQLADRYAIAFLNTVQEPLSVTVCESIARVIAYYKRMHELLLFLQLSLFSKYDKEEALARVRRWYKIPDLFATIDLLLLEEHRIFLLPLVYERIITHAHKRAGRIVCSVTTATELSQVYRKKVFACIEQRSLQIPLITWIIDPTLIAGIKIQTAEWLWEDSLDGRLKALSAYLSA